MRLPWSVDEPAFTLRLWGRDGPVIVVMATLQVWKSHTGVSRYLTYS